MALNLKDGQLKAVRKLEKEIASDNLKSDHALYRGIKKSSGHPLLVKEIRQNRKPRDSSIPANLVYKALRHRYNKDTPSRLQCAFATTYSGDAEIYGDVYAIFPSKNCIEWYTIGDPHDSMKDLGRTLRDLNDIINPLFPSGKEEEICNFVKEHTNGEKSALYIFLKTELSNLFTKHRRSRHAIAFLISNINQVQREIRELLSQVAWVDLDYFHADLNIELRNLAKFISQVREHAESIRPLKKDESCTEAMIEGDYYYALEPSLLRCFDWYDKENRLALKYEYRKR